MRVSRAINPTSICMMNMYFQLMVYMSIKLKTQKLENVLRFVSCSLKINKYIFWVYKVSNFDFATSAVWACKSVTHTLSD